jgi:hypothetical protein
VILITAGAQTELAPVIAPVPAGQVPGAPIPAPLIR